MMHFLSNLNDVQKEVVTSTEGAVMVLAGAGSGKTRTLVMRIVYLIEELGIGHHQILALTFSNKAAKEMRERIAHYVGHEAQAIQVTTFHAFCAKVLRGDAQYMGLSRNFVIYDQSESLAIVKNILQRYHISNKQVSPYEVLTFVSNIKNRGIYLNGECEAPESDQKHQFYHFYLEYESELRRSNAIDFGGLITAALQLFQKYPDVLKRYQNRLKYILVDEYQDTNRAQFELIHLLAKERRNICVVGDEDQSIYSWRGADINNIFDFEKYFPEARTLKLEQNYRSSKNIIQAASCVISHNRQRKGKKMWTQNPGGESLEIVECPREKDEANYVSDEIEALLGESQDLNEIAVFYRANSQSRLIEDHLRKVSIPYRIIGGVKFYDRKEIKDLLGYLKMIVNPRDSLALSRVINVPARGIGATTLRKLEGESIQRGLPLWETMKNIIENEEEFSHLKLSSKIKSSLEEFITLINDIRGQDSSGEALPSVLCEKVLNESGYAQQLKMRKDYESKARIENLEEFLTAVQQYEKNVPKPSLSGFLEQISLETPNDEGRNTNFKGEVSLMTAHGAKGLEFHYVFIIGAEENIFPSYQSLEEGESRIEEERRLFYVAMTRAMKRLYICFARGRLTFGKIKFNGPSRFIDEIPKGFYHWKKLERSHHSDSSLNSHWDDEVVYQVEQRTTSIFKKGKRIRHSLYGKGKILSSEGQGNDEKVTILFYDGTRKKFMVKYAPLELL